MAHRKVSIYKYVRIEGADGNIQWQYCKPVFAGRYDDGGKLKGNGKLKPDWVWVETEVEGLPVPSQEHHPEGYYCLRVGGKYINIGNDASKVLQRQKDAEEDLNIVNLGGTPPVRKYGVKIPAADLQAPLFNREGGREPEGAAAEVRVTLKAAIDKYISDIETAITLNKRRPRTLTSAKFILEEFRQHVSKRLLRDVTKADLDGYIARCLKQGASPRTAQNKFVRVNAFLRASGINIAKYSDAPRVVEDDEVEVYEQDELERFFAACTTVERIAFGFLLASGLREQEFMYLPWDCVDFRKGFVRIKEHPEHDYYPKTYARRNVYLAPEVVESLRLLKSCYAVAGHKLVFPGEHGKPEGHWLRRCKAIAKKAGLDPERFWLHKFRATMATTCLRNGMDIETLRKQLGHSKDSDALWHYLAAVSKDKMQDAVAAAAPKVPGLLGTVKQVATVAVLLFALIFSGTRAQAQQWQWPEAPAPQRVIDGQFLSIMAGLAAAKSADFYTTAEIQGEGGYETDSWFGTHPSDKRLVLENVGIYSAQALLSYELKKPHSWIPKDKWVRRFWWLPAAYWSISHVYWSGHNAALVDGSAATVSTYHTPGAPYSGARHGGAR